MRRQRLKDHQQEQHLFRVRIIIATVVAALLLGLLGVRLTYLQVVNHSHFATLSQNNRVRIEALPPPRGLIFDRHGVVIAENRPSHQLELIPEQVRDLEDTLARLGELIRLEPQDLERIQRGLRTSRGFNNVAVKSNLSDEEIALFALNRHLFPGVDLYARPARHYPYGASLAHVLGYMGRIDENELQRIDRRNYAGTMHIGKTGVERFYEDKLHGQVGLRRVEANAQGRVLRTLEEQPPISGQDITLTIDVTLQLAAEQALGQSAGAVVALDPRNGEVLAMVSTPSFDPGLFFHGIPQHTYSELMSHPRRPLFNRVLAGQYPPGSTLKPVLALGGLEHELIVPSRSMYTPGYYQLPNYSRRFRDWTYHGWVNMDEAIARSSDVYFYDLGHRMGIDRMSEFFGLFGIGEATGIDLLGERRGVLPSRAWKRQAMGESWSPAETIIAAIGQGYMLTTPLQLASITATLAMRGQRVTPHLLKSHETDMDLPSSERGRNGLQPVTVRRDSLWDPIIEAMVNTMHQPYGTAFRTGRDALYQMAGKTGTAQVFGLAEDEEYDEELVPEKLRDHALFVGFAPADDPRIAVAVIVENGGSGGRVAAPIARQVVDAYLLGDGS